MSEPATDLVSLSAAVATAQGATAAEGTGSPALPQATPQSPCYTTGRAAAAVQTL